jgi:hypothetical protein
MTVLQKFNNEPLLYGMAVYNLTQVSLCAYMIYGAVTAYLANGYAPICNGYDKKNPAMANILWVFYVSKALDFFDTIFIVLRRKWTQLSTLHTYHHTTIFLVRALATAALACAPFLTQRLQVWHTTNFALLVVGAPPPLTHVCMRALMWGCVCVSARSRRCTGPTSTPGTTATFTTRSLRTRLFILSCESLLFIAQPCACFITHSHLHQAAKDNACAL